MKEKSEMKKKKKRELGFFMVRREPPKGGPSESPGFSELCPNA